MRNTHRYGDRSCLRWDLRADTAADLAELDRALREWTNDGPGIVSNPAADTVRVERCV